eukprot:1148609-Rhodomonas_salina.1
MARRWLFIANLVALYSAAEHSDDSELLYNKHLTACHQQTNHVFQVRQIRAEDSADLCAFYNEKLGNASKEAFSPLGRVAEIQTCSEIASGVDISRFDLLLLGGETSNELVGWTFWYEGTVRADYRFEPLFGIAIADSHQGLGFGALLTQALLEAALADSSLAFLRLN